MKTEQEYIKDLSDIRHMMEKSTKFLSLAGWSGIMAGIYALAGAWFIYRLPGFQSGEIFNATNGTIPEDVFTIMVVGVIVLMLAIGTCIFLSYHKAHSNNEVLWNTTTRRLILNMAIPLVSGGVFILILLSHGSFELMASLTLIFYGLSLINASRFTFDELRYMGISEIVLGLIAANFIHLSMLCWTLGFGILHIVYGIYMHWRYER
jgi:hypothetical protein